MSGEEIFYGVSCDECKKRPITAPSFFAPNISETDYSVCQSCFLKISDECKAKASWRCCSYTDYLRATFAAIDTSGEGIISPEEVRTCRVA